MTRLDDLLRELENLGVEHDAKTTIKQQQLLNITRDTGEFLSLLVTLINADAILEIGTSNAYSTLWLARALPPQGRVISLENDPQKVILASHNIERAQLDHKIKLLNMSAGDYLAENSASFDLIFLDANRAEYLHYADSLVAAINPGGLLICDNAISHADELASFIQWVRKKPNLTCCTIPVGKGEFLATKSHNPR